MSLSHYCSIILPNGLNYETQIWLNLPSRYLDHFRGWERGDEFAIYAAVNGFCHGCRLVGGESTCEG